MEYKRHRQQKCPLHTFLESIYLEIDFIHIEIVWSCLDKVIWDINNFMVPPMYINFNVFACVYCTCMMGNFMFMYIL